MPPGSAGGELLFKAWVVTAVAATLTVAASSSIAADGRGLVIKYQRPFGIDGMFSVINGEVNGHIEVNLTVLARSGGVDVMSFTPGVPGSVWWRSGTSGKFGMHVKESVDVGGQRKSIKVPRVARAGPGENITLGLRCPVAETAGVSAEVVVEYYDDSGSFVGRTEPRRFHVPQHKRSAMGWTFRRRDLRERR
jgi:hypothetical protein